MGIPNFFLAVLLIQLFAVKLGWLPPAGPGGFEHLVLPAVVLAMESMAVNMRLMRSSTLEELSKDYVRTLNAKGLSLEADPLDHALRNALVPVIALAGVTIPLVLGYTLIVEVIFRYEGLGFQFVQSITKRDYALAQTLALLFTAIVIFSNFLADVAHQLVDPRVRDRARLPDDDQRASRRPRRRRERPRGSGGAPARRFRAAQGEQAGAGRARPDDPVPARRSRSAR